MTWPWKHNAALFQSEQGPAESGLNCSEQAIFLLEMHEIKNNFHTSSAYLLTRLKEKHGIGKQADDSDVCGCAVWEPGTLNSKATWRHLASDKEWQYLWGRV